MNKDKSVDKNESKKSGHFIQSFVKDERGEIGIKQIAATVGVIIIIGAVVTAITDGSFLNTWISWVWTKFTEVIDDTFTT